MGMLLQRGLAGSLLLHNCYAQIPEGVVGLPMLSVAVHALAGLFLLLGLWTPVAGTAVFMTLLWAFVTGAREPGSTEIASILGGTIAMVGPGAWSLDARIFGRKHIETRHPQK